MKRAYHAILYSLMGVLVLGAVLWGVGRSARAEETNKQLSGVYDGALLSAMDALKSAQYKLEKALLSQSGSQQAKLFAGVSADAGVVSASLSMMPHAHTALRDTMKFANQLGDFSASLIRAEDTPLSSSERESTDAMVEALKLLYERLKTAQGEARAQNTLESAYWEEPDALARPIEQVGGENKIDYPTLIYDGPFSDARQTGTPRALGTKLIGREEAMRIAQTFVGQERVVGATQGADTGGDIPAYGVTVRLNDVTLEVAVSKTGGKVVYMMPDTASFEMLKSIEECREAALQFLLSHDYAQMQPTYFQVYNGLATINFAATQGACLLYPDLVKVQVRMDTAQVVGLEASHYLMNHTSRAGLTPQISSEEAQGAVSELLSITSSRLCLIPHDAQEVLAYEFTGSYKGHVYLVYINAKTGQQADILKLIEDETGLLTA